MMLGLHPVATGGGGRPGGGGGAGGAGGVKNIFTTLSEMARAGLRYGICGCVLSNTYLLPSLCVSRCMQQGVGCGFGCYGSEHDRTGDKMDLLFSCRYYEEFEHKIPREELARIEAVVKEEVGDP
jgi:hypothetical protein